MSELRTAGAATEEAPELETLQLLLREAARSPLLTPAEVVRLAKRMERGDPAAKERLITANLPMRAGGSARPASGRSRTRAS